MEIPMSSSRLANINILDKDNNLKQKNDISMILIKSQA